MSGKLWLPGALALALLHPGAAFSATDQDLEEIRAQIREMKQSYEARIQALEQRLRDAESKAASGPAPRAAPAPAPAPVAAAPSGGSLAAFNPAISAILGGTYANLSQNPRAYRLSGFPTAPDTGPGKRGLSLGESELTFSANVDHKFSGALTFSIAPDNTVGVEEAYGIFNGAPYGVVPKFGRFLSAAGYQNEQHAHAWDFVDTPLAYDAFLGGQFRNDGLQLRWVAPTDQFIELGGEIGNGDRFPGSPRNRNGVGSGVLFARTGGDLNESHNWLAGLSYLQTRAEGRADTVGDMFGNDASTAFTGRSRTLGAQLVWKYAPNGNPHVTNFKLQAEYFWRREEGDLTYYPLESQHLSSTAPFSSRQGGGYVQGVYQFMPLWRAGLRYDRLAPGTPDYGANGIFLATSSFHPERATAMVDWSPSEFSRLRLQFAQAKVAPGFTDNEWFVQYILSLGAHGAHRY